MTNYHSVPVPTNLMMSFTLTNTSTKTYIGISSDVNISEIDWDVSGIKPLSTTTSQDGKSMTLTYRRKTLSSYNLNAGTYQRHYTGPDLLEYLQTSDSMFGSYTATDEPSSLGLFAALVVAAAAGGFAITTM